MRDDWFIQSPRPFRKLSNDELRSWVVKVAEIVLKSQGHVSALETLCRMGLLGSGGLLYWQKGGIDVLQPLIQGRPDKVVQAMCMFDEWGRQNGLERSELPGRVDTRKGPVELRVWFDAAAEVEAVCRVRYTSPALAGKQREKPRKQTDEPSKAVVFQVIRDSKCSECGTEIEQDSLLFMDKDQPLCMACAGMGDLEYLPAGDAALTRRATKHSARSFVVVRFSRSRGRYERKGILVEPAAIEQAERECAEDAGERAAARARDAVRRREDDGVFVARMAQAIRELFPKCPPTEAAKIAHHAGQRGSGRVGRTAAARDFGERALTLAVVAAVRHNHTDYDELLASGVDRADARDRVSDAVAEKLDEWRGR